MTDVTPLPAGFATTRVELQRLATHLLARARAAEVGRFGLRAIPGGIATPAFGPTDTVLRIAGTILLRDRRTAGGSRVDAFELTGRTLAEAARSVGVDLSVPFAPGADAPDLGDPDARIILDLEAVDVVLSWFGYGARVLDGVTVHLVEPTTVQLWPEHFDIALSATTPHGGVTLGASPGDRSVPEPYLYVAPFGAERPGDPTLWNAPFGAVLPRSELVRGSAVPVDAGVAFLRQILAALGA